MEGIILWTCLYVQLEMLLHHETQSLSPENGISCLSILELLLYKDHQLVL